MASVTQAIAAWAIAAATPLSAAIAAPVPVPVETADVEGATEAVETIRELDREIAAQRGGLSPRQLELAIEWRNQAVERLAIGVIEARRLPRPMRRLRMEERFQFELLVGESRYFAWGGLEEVQASITAPQGWSVWQRPWRGVGTWLPHTPGQFITARAYDFRLLHGQSGANCVHERVEVRNQPTMHQLRCP